MAAILTFLYFLQKITYTIGYYNFSPLTFHTSVLFEQEVLKRTNIVKNVLANKLIWGPRTTNFCIFAHFTVFVRINIGYDCVTNCWMVATLLWPISGWARWIWTFCFDESNKLSFLFNWTCYKTHCYIYVCLCLTSTISTHGVKAK